MTLDRLEKGLKEQSLRAMGWKKFRRSFYPQGLALKSTETIVAMPTLERMGGDLSL
ncbi:hypothetical protein [Desulfocicer niacini]